MLQQYCVSSQNNAVLDNSLKEPVLQKFLQLTNEVLVFFFYIKNKGYRKHQHIIPNKVLWCLRQNKLYYPLSKSVCLIINKDKNDSLNDFVQEWKQL